MSGDIAQHFAGTFFALALTFLYFWWRTGPDLTLVLGLIASTLLCLVWLAA